MRRFMSIILSLIILLSIMCSCNSPFISVASAYSVQYNSNTSYTYNDLDTLIELIAEQISNMNAAHQMADAARQLGYSENHDVIELAVNEYDKANELRQSYQNVYDNLMEHWHQKEKEYPVATYIWSYFKNLGYNNQVCAGILGNIMTEVGGNTLNIQYELGNSSYYGMCQWNKAYSEVWGASLEEQCNYLENTIEYEFNTFGHAYKRGFDYEDFLNMTSITDAALAFAKCYERCGSGSYTVRQNNAIIAYNYFVS